MSDAAFVCSECTQPGPDGGECPCGAGARVDLGDPAIVEMLVEIDDRAAERAKQRHVWIGVACGLLVVIGILFTAPKLILAIPLPLPFANPIKVIGLMILIAAGAAKAASALFPARRKFPGLVAAASVASPELARMRGTSRSTWIAVSAGVGLLFLAGVATTLVERLAVDGPRPTHETRLRPGGEPPIAAAPMPLLRAADFADLTPGVLSLRGKVALGDQRHALLYRAPAGHLVVCTITPDQAPYVDCSEPKTTIRPQTARLVEGKSEVWIHGVTHMGATPEETKHGVQGMDGAELDGDANDLRLSPERPSLPPPSKTWFSGSLGATQLALARSESGDLMLSVGDTEAVLVMKDKDRGGPATGMPITFVGKENVVVLFQNERGLGALRLSADGEIVPVGGPSRGEDPR